MAKFVQPDQNLSFDIPDVGQLFYGSGDNQNSTLYLRDGNNVHALDFQTLGGTAFNKKLADLGLTPGGSYKAYDPNGAVNYTPSAEYQKLIDAGLGDIVNINQSNGTFSLNPSNGNALRKLGQKYFQDTTGVDPLSIANRYNEGDARTAGLAFGAYAGDLANFKAGTPPTAPETITKTISPVNPQGADIKSSLTGDISISPSLQANLAAAGASPEQIAKIATASKAGQPLTPEFLASIGLGGAGNGASTTPPAGTTVAPPAVALQPGQAGPEVKQLQDWLVSQGYMTTAQESTGPGTFGPQTKAALAKWQLDHGVDVAGNPGFFGPKTMAAIAAAGAGKGAGMGAGQSGFTGAGSGTGTGASPDGSTPTPGPSDFIKMYSQVIKDLGLTDIKTAFQKSVDAQASIENELNDKITEIQDDPWLAQGVADARIAKLKDKYKTKLDIEVNRQQLYDSLYKEGVQQAQFLTTGEYNQMQDAATLAEKKLEAAQKLTQLDPSAYKEVQGGLFDIKNGTWLIPPQKGSGVSNVVTDNERALLNQFNSEPIVKDFNTILAKKLSVDKIIQSGVGGPGDLAIVYEFMKGLDPSSVVRESEYQSAAKSGNIFAGALAQFNGYFKETGGFLPDAVKASFANIVNSKLAVQTQLYNNVADQYKGIASRQGLNPANVVPDYSAAAPKPISKGNLSDSAFVEKAIQASGLNYNQTINGAPKGQIPVVRNDTGEIGYIPVEEFTNSTYTKL